MFSVQARNLAALIVSGYFIGFALILIDPSGFLLVAMLQENEAVLHGAVWQLFTSIIVAPPDLYPGLIDVAFNALSVLYLDRLVSGVYTQAEYYGVFLSSAVAGNVISLLGGPSQASFGASGGIFGLVAGLVAYDYAASGRPNLQLVLWFLLIFVASSFLLPGVDWFAHSGGALVGLALGYQLGRRSRHAEY
ncbi:MAG TPA: rhomboid family intramembrane serine protease [Nitrososphaerales archaeon]|nr:rhomboid family intramembrane serine protease [Nitrososphaerales archaeon]